MTTDEKKASPKRPKKAPIVVGVVAAILVVAGAGMWVWHEQPSFCGAICHVPMDPYLDTYDAEPGQAAADKWGNDVADAMAMTAAAHRVDAGATCLSCHTPVLAEQVSEGVNWVSGNYEVVLNDTYDGVLLERGAADLTEASGKASDELCLNEACHAMTRDELAEQTADRAFNPHVVQHDKLDCTTCHKAHRASVYYCTKCHAEAADELPEGWLTMKEAGQLEATA
ncbi:MAG: cytochrome c3 family protein [Eggerthellaceae bacterium]|nr:cytochrome c3 family protein [Eggerthellaceae bacterium]